MIKGGIILKAAAIYGALVLSLIGIIVVESAETIKTGYQIAYLNKIWQEKNFEHMTLARRINNYTETGKTEKFVERQFNLRRAEPAQIVFMDDKNASK